MEKNYGSHIPLLEYIFSIHSFKSCIEFGLGNHSTLFFLSKKINLITIETNKQWINNFKVLDNENHEIIYSRTENVYEILDRNFKNINFDLGFVDGPRNTRWLCVNKLAAHCDVIIAHDTNKPSYNWEKVELPAQYEEFIYTQQKTWTTIFSCNKSLNTKLYESNFVIKS